MCGVKMRQTGRYFNAKAKSFSLPRAEPNLGQRCKIDFDDAGVNFIN
jgi:hypothetical protein